MTTSSSEDDEQLRETTSATPASLAQDKASLKSGVGQLNRVVTPGKLLRYAVS